MWRSLVSRLVRVQEASGSNPDTPTNGKSLETQRVSRLFLFGDTLCELHQNTKSAQKSAQLSEKAFESRRCTARKGVSYGSNPREQKEWQSGVLSFHILFGAGRKGQAGTALRHLDTARGTDPRKGKESSRTRGGLVGARNPQAVPRGKERGGLWNDIQSSARETPGRFLLLC